jgi:hypothetical protein
MTVQIDLFCLYGAFSAVTIAGAHRDLRKVFISNSEINVHYFSTIVILTC